jgi:membrane protein YdbS with pleckstrin-like domain
MNSSRGSNTGAAEEGDPISATAAPGAGGRAESVATRFPSTAAGEPDPVLLAGDLPTERHRLPARVTRYWRWRTFYSSLPLLVLLISGAIALPWGPWWVRWGIVGVSVVVIAACLIILPPIRYRVFWYAISQTEIDVQRGIIFTKRSVLPMRRVQTLFSERGPIADHYRLANLRIRTAAGSVRLSGLDRREADELSERISRLTDLADDV